MKLSIKYKLFIIVLTASIIIISCMLLFVQMSFKHGFDDYINQQKERNLYSLSQVLERLYNINGSWKFLKDHPVIWDDLLRKAFIRERAKKRVENNFNRNDGRRSKQKMGKIHDEPNSPLIKKIQIILLDNNSNVIFGKNKKYKKESFITLYNEGNVIGWVGIIYKSKQSDETALGFIKKQTKTFIFIAITMILISIIVAISLAYYLEGPVKRVIKGTRLLTKGDYKVRIPVKSNDEMGQLSKDFNKLAKTLEESETSRQKFMADIAHELRTPLTLMGGELEAIKDGVRQFSPETMERLSGDVSHLIRLVNDVNELSKSDQGSLLYKKKNINIKNIINNSIDKYKPEFEKKNIQLKNETDEKEKIIFADQERLEQLFSNILYNSLRYTDNGGEVIINTEIINNKIIINFRDSSPGVPDSSLNKLFKRLYRVDDSRNRKTGGAGIGLAICKNITNAHDGSIEAKHSDLGGLWIQIIFNGI